MKLQHIVLPIRKVKDPKFAIHLHCMAVVDNCKLVIFQWKIIKLWQKRYKISRDATYYVDR